MKFWKALLTAIKFAAFFIVPAFCISVGMNMILSIAFIIQNDRTPYNFEFTALGEKYMNVASLATQLFIMLLLVLYSSIRNRNLITYVKLKRIGLYKIMLAIAIGVLSTFINITADYTMFAYTGYVHSYYTKEYIKSFLFIAQILTISLGAGVVEEILYRGLMYNELRDCKIGIKTAIVLQAIVFGFLHLEARQSSYAFVSGIILALAYIWTDSLWVSIIIHGVHNITIEAIQLLDINFFFLQYKIPVLIASTIVFFCFMHLLFKERPIQQRDLKAEQPG